MSSEILNIKGVSKYFAGVVALDNVDFSINAGEIRALIGENGAGKSTLIKVLTGIYKKDRGNITFCNKSLDTNNVLEIQEKGISTIYQELNLIPYLSIAENIFLGREIKSKNNGHIDWKKTNQKATEIIQSFNVDLDVRTPINQLSTAHQQITSIARAISYQAKLIIMDEPTSSLDEKEVEILMGIIRKLKKQNIAVIFISHRLSEIFEICETATVLKDGQNVGTYDIDDLDEHKLVSLMIGREYVENQKSAEKFNEFATVLLEANSISSGMRVSNVSIQVNQGECVGIAGLLGSGRTEFANVLFGAANEYEGKITVLGEEVYIKRPRDAISLGLAYLTEDRRHEGIIPNMTVRENITLAILPKISRFGVVNRAKEKKIVEKYIDMLSIKTPNMNKKIKNLSGGNQQKVLLGRWLATEPRLVILDEPTRGIDVGAKAEIENIIKQLVEKKIGILMISSEINELVRNCSRIFVFREGVLLKELRGEEIFEKNVINVIASGKKD